MNSSRHVLRCHSRIALIVFAFWLSSTSTPVSAQQPKPNLSGTWKLNLNKSKLAPLHRAGSDRYKIKHSEPRLEVEHTFDGRSETSSYVTDGKEHTANMSWQDGDTRAKTYWDGDTLVMERLRLGSWMSRYILSQDGKSLTVNHHVYKSSFSDAFDESLTYEKQQ
jgi:hypothetical protein